MTLFEHYCACENCFCALFVIYLYIAWLLFVYVVADDLQPNPKSQPFQKCCDVKTALLSCVL